MQVVIFDIGFAGDSAVGNGQSEVQEVDLIARRVCCPFQFAKGQGLQKGIYGNIRNLGSPY